MFRMSAAQCDGSREEQEDSVNASHPDLQNSRGILCCVSDGMGGLNHGKEASQLVVDRMIQTFEQMPVSENPGRILLHGCFLAQQDVLAIQDEPEDSGATLVAVLIRNDRCSFLSVGDSRIYLFRGGGLIRLTREQNRGRSLDMMVEFGYLPPEARNDRNRGGLTGFIGMKMLNAVHRNATPFALRDGDRIVLMSDGVFNTLSEPEMEQAMRLPEEEVAEELIRLVECGNKQHQDNASVLVIDCTEEGPMQGVQG